MSSFTKSKIYVTPDNRLVAEEDFAFEIGWLGSGYKVLVPAGFHGDVSMPWILVQLLPYGVIQWLLKRLRRAALVHDFLRTQRLDMPLWRTDLIFLEAMYAAGVRDPLRTLTWLAVRTNKRRD